MVFVIAVIFFVLYYGYRRTAEKVQRSESVAGFFGSRYRMQTMAVGSSPLSESALGDPNNRAISFNMVSHLPKIGYC